MSQRSPNGFVRKAEIERLAMDDEPDVLERTGTISLCEGLFGDGVLIP